MCPGSAAPSRTPRAHPRQLPRPLARGGRTPLRPPQRRARIGRMVSQSPTGRCSHSSPHPHTPRPTGGQPAQPVRQSAPGPGCRHRGPEVPRRTGVPPLPVVSLLRRGSSADSLNRFGYQPPRRPSRRAAHHQAAHPVGQVRLVGLRPRVPYRSRAAVRQPFPARRRRGRLLAGCPSAPQRRHPCGRDGGGPGLTVRQCQVGASSPRTSRASSASAFGPRPGPASRPRWPGTPAGWGRRRGAAWRRAVRRPPARCSVGYGVPGLIGLIC